MSSSSNEKLNYLVMRLSGPMMSFGQMGRKTYRTTAQYPSKSSLMGINASALGIERDNEEAIKELASLEATVFALKFGERQIDFHTVGCGTDDPERIPLTADAELERSKGGPKGKRKQLVIPKEYLADADFVVILAGDAELVTECANALKRPYRPLFLGRKEFIPSRPIFDSIHETEKASIERIYTIAKEMFPNKRDFNLPFMSDARSTQEADDFLMDIPIRFSQSSGGFLRRMVKYGQMPVR